MAPDLHDMAVHQRRQIRAADLGRIAQFKTRAPRRCRLPQPVTARLAGHQTRYRSITRLSVGIFAVVVGRYRTFTTDVGSPSPSW